MFSSENVILLLVAAVLAALAGTYKVYSSTRRHPLPHRIFKTNFKQVHAQHSRQRSSKTSL